MVNIFTILLFTQLIWFEESALLAKYRHVLAKMRQRLSGGLHAKINAIEEVRRRPIYLMKNLILCLKT